jgi:hypothetical protein
MKLADNLLPWQPSTDKSGYTKLDLHLQLTAEFWLDVRRQKPREEQPGNFAVYRNDVRVSNLTHQGRSDAIAEAERYFYSLDEYKGSNTATALNVIVQNGRAAFRNGQSVYANPHQKTSVDHSQWAAGWLEESTRGLAESIVQRFEQGAIASGRAVETMDNDMKVATSRLQAYNLLLDYAEELADGPRPREYDSSSEYAMQFIHVFRSGDVAKISKEFPGWSQYLFDRKLGPPPDAPISVVVDENSGVTATPEELDEMGREAAGMPPAGTVK